ncbi:leucine-rich repeat domain-containing protein [Aquimarina sp. 433]
MRNNIRYIFLSILICLCTGCSTYTTFYSKTHKEVVGENISKIHRLDLSNQNLTQLPANIEHIKDLRMINLSNNPDLDLSNTFERLSIHTNLEVLILDSLDINIIPESISQFKNLKQISLAHNTGLLLEVTLSRLSELPIEFLNLANNNLTVLPENIINITTLKDLNLSYNNMKDPKTYNLLGQLPKLYSLWIDHNELETLPATIGNLKQIRFLYIDHNNLAYMPDSMIDMKKLWVIHAGYNKFKKLPTVFAKMKVLLMVHINNNEITTIPKIYETEKYPLAGLLLDNNAFSKEEVERAKQIFNGFFLLSFEQKVYK